MMKSPVVNLLTIIFITISYQGIGQKMSWPKTAAATIAKEFAKAYNIKSVNVIKDFVLEHYHYSKSDSTSINKTVEEWMDLYYRYGPIKPHSISINEEYDIEVWMECNITKNWFAVEFILNEDTKKVRATGLLKGEQPKRVSNPSKNDKELLKAAEHYLKQNTELGFFQGVVLIQKGKEIILHKAYGVNNAQLKSPNALDTRMRISSITKPITVIACLQLVQNGYLELDKPIANYLPELPSKIADHITIRSLIMHTSGYELDGIKGFREELKKAKSMQEVYELHLKFLPKWEHYNTFKPRNKFDYSNDSFDLLAIIIEKITGLTFPEYLEKYIFKIANMTNTSFSKENVATPYRYDLKVDRLSDYSNYYPYAIGHISGAGGLKSTAKDLQKLFNTLYHTNQLLGMPQKNLMFSLLMQSYSTTNPDIGESPLINTEQKFNNTPKVRNGRSMGFSISYDTNLSYGHNGTNIGNSAELRYFPHVDYLMIVLCNNRSGAHNFFRFFNNHLPKE